MYSQPTAPQSIGGVLDSGFALFRASFVDVFVLAVVAALVTAPANFLGPYIAQSTPGLALYALVSLGVILMIAVAGVLYGAIIARMDAIARGGRRTVPEALAIGLRRLVPMVVAGVIGGIVITLGLVLVIVPGLIFMVWLVFAPTAAVIEPAGPLESLSYSRALVRGHWWRTAALLTIIGIILMVIYLALGIVVGIAIMSNPEAAAAGRMPWYVDLLVAPLMSAVAAPLSYALLLSIYYDLKLRREGADLAARIAATA